MVSTRNWQSRGPSTASLRGGILFLQMSLIIIIGGLGQKESGGVKQIIGHFLMGALIQKTYGYLSIILRFP